jgi:hypothetical protein
MEATSKTLLDLLKAGLAQVQPAFRQHYGQLMPLWPAAN